MNHKKKNIHILIIMKEYVNGRTVLLTIRKMWYLGIFEKEQHTLSWRFSCLKIVQGSRVYKMHSLHLFLKMNSARWLLISCPLGRWGKTSLKRWISFTRVTQRTGDRAGAQLFHSTHYYSAALPKGPSCIQLLAKQRRKKDAHPSPASYLPPSPQKQVVKGLPFYASTW